MQASVFQDRVELQGQQIHQVEGFWAITSSKILSFSASSASPATVALGPCH
jgi:hypothetical protein